MAKRGEAARAMGIAIADSTFNGVLYAVLAFMLLPYYGKIIVLFGRPEFLGFMMMALACVGFVASKNVFLSVVAITFGLFLGFIGQDSVGNARFAFGWEYLENGVGMIVLLSGLFGIPELLDGFRQKIKSAAPPMSDDYWKQLFQGFRDARTHWRDMVRGGLLDL
jgi:putative tricarboxylic transport membrane protein